MWREPSLPSRLPQLPQGSPAGLARTAPAALSVPHPARGQVGRPGLPGGASLPSFCHRGALDQSGGHRAWPGRWEEPAAGAGGSGMSSSFPFSAAQVVKPWTRRKWPQVWALPVSLGTPQELCEADLVSVGGPAPAQPGSAASFCSKAGAWRSPGQACSQTRTLSDEAWGVQKGEGALGNLFWPWGSLQTLQRSRVRSASLAGISSLKSLLWWRGNSCSK